MQKLDKSKLVKNLGKKQKLVPYLEKELAVFEEPWTFDFKPKEFDDAWHPSGDCTPSPLELYDKANAYLDEVEKGIDPTPKVDSRRKAFMVGHYWHQLLQHIVLNKLEFCTPEAIERRGFSWWGANGSLELSTNVRFKDWTAPTRNYHGKPFHWVTGAGDVAPLVLPKGWEGIVDFKTMGSTFDPQAKKLPFADKYECQINIYMDLFDQDKALIVGIEKAGPHSFNEFEFERNQPLIDAIYDKWKFVSSCIEEGVSPKENVEFPLPLRGPVESS